MSLPPSRAGEGLSAGIYCGGGTAPFLWGPFWIWRCPDSLLDVRWAVLWEWHLCFLPLHQPLPLSSGTPRALAWGGRGASSFPLGSVLSDRNLPPFCGVQPKDRTILPIPTIYQALIVCLAQH